MAENVFEDKALQKYLREISKIEVLKTEEEYELALLAKEGDKKAMNKLLTANLKFVVKIAAHYQNRGLTLAELISEGNTGLIKAIEKFEPEKENKLISYAVWWIKQRILFALAEKTSIVRLPLGKANLVNKIKQAKDKVYSYTGKEATLDEISTHTKLEKKAIRKINKQTINVVSLDQKTYTKKQDKVGYSDFLSDPNIVDPQSLYYREKVKESIYDSIKKLPDREAYIIREYFGLDGQKSKNFAQIAEKMGLSRERIRQIQKKALEKILSNTNRESKEDIDYLA
ncbi:MAG: RNA polymerase sigma factor RpoD/SigA [Candidatus Cloacimonetes bacterium]|nr:RNA polymerase sigma factor RpoD/SigA [Candidatus Cloacimonadota bacterium]